MSTKNKYLINIKHSLLVIIIQNNYSIIYQLYVFQPHYYTFLILLECIDNIVSNEKYLEKYIFTSDSNYY